MGLLRKSFQTITGGRKGITQPSSGGLGFAPYTLRSERTYTRDVGDGSGSSLVVAIVNWISRTFPDASPMVQRFGEDEWHNTPDDPLVSLLEMPNPHYSGVALWMATLLSWTVEGNAYWLKERNGSGRVVNLWYIPHFLIEPKWPKDGSEYISHYEYKPGGRTQKLPVEDVVHFRNGIDPQNTRKGLSPLRSLLREIYTDQEAARFSASMLRNMGVPGLVITPASDETIVLPDDLEAAKADFAARTSGDRRGEALFMGSPMRMEQFGFSPEQMDLTALRRIPEERVSAVTGVPAAVVGFGVGLELTKVGATLDGYQRLGWENCLIPTQRLMAAEMRPQLVGEFHDDLTRWRIVFDTSDVRALQESETDRHERVLSGVEKGVVRIDTAQGELGYPIDESQAGYVRSGLTMFVPAESDPLTLYAAPAPVAEGEPSPPEEEPEPAKARTEHKALDSDAYMRALDQQRAITERQMAASLEQACYALGERAAQAYLGQKAILRGLEHKAVDPLDEVIVAGVLAAINLDVFQQTVFAPIYSSAYGVMAKAAVDTLQAQGGITFGFGIPDLIAREVIATGGTRLGLLDLPADTRDALFRALGAARAEGLGIPETARRIREHVSAGRYTNGGANYRAETIARTETRYAQGVASYTAGTRAGFTEFVVFDGRLGETDAECMALDGSVVDADRVMDLLASEHPRGTRSVSPHVGSQI